LIEYVITRFEFPLSWLIIDDS